jgi:putative acetyltransferase
MALVARHAGVIVGHVGFPRLAVDVDGRALPAAGLAPLAVAPSVQRRGIGGALVRAGIERLRAQGETLVLVVGDPRYYARFGFDPATAQPFACAYAGPHFLALRLAESAPRAGRVRYPRAFDTLC